MPFLSVTGKNLVVLDVRGVLLKSKCALDLVRGVWEPTDCLGGGTTRASQRRGYTRPGYNLGCLTFIRWL